MARIRSVHPGLFTDADWVECSSMARILIIGLWTHADDQGLFVWRAKEIKMTILPGDDVDIVALLDELSKGGLIRTYEVAGKAYGAIRNFRKWQRPQKPNALYPLPDFIADYVGLEGQGFEADQEPVSDHYDTATVIPIQREDVGGRSIGIGGGSARDALGWPVDPNDWPQALLDETGMAADLAKHDWPLRTISSATGWHHTDKFEWVDVVTGIREGMVGKGNDPPRSWKYFSPVIARAKQNRLTKTPEARNEPDRKPYQTTGQRNKDSTIAAFKSVFGGDADGDETAVVAYR